MEKMLNRSSALIRWSFTGALKKSVTRRKLEKQLVAAAVIRVNRGDGRTKTIRLPLILAIFATCICVSHGQSQTSGSAQPTTAAGSSATHPQVYEVVVQRNVPMKTRDGVTLFSDVYRPKSSDKFPVILMRTPYDKSVGWAVASAFKIAPHGYVVVIQDVRGRYTSEGEWYPFRHEQNDGYDTVEWAATLEGANGKVGMMGASYVGATQMLAAIANPQHLAAIAPNTRAR